MTDVSKDRIGSRERSQRASDADGQARTLDAAATSSALTGCARSSAPARPHADRAAFGRGASRSSRITERSATSATWARCTSITMATSASSTSGGGLMNVAVVVPISRAQEIGEGQTEFFEQWIATRPHLAERFVGAERVTPDVRATGPFATASRAARGRRARRWSATRPISSIRSRAKGCTPRFAAASCSRRSSRKPSRHDRSNEKRAFSRATRPGAASGIRRQVEAGANRRHGHRVSLFPQQRCEGSLAQQGHG